MIDGGRGTLSESVPRSGVTLVAGQCTDAYAYSRLSTPLFHSWGKKVLSLSGAQDKLVHPSFSQPFLSRLAISHPEGRTGEQVGFKVRWLDGVKHEVTEDMVREAGQWIGKWGLLG